MILLLDNYDSFVHNLARYFRLLGCETKVVRSDRIDAAGCEALAPDAIVISPGPRGPEDAGCSVDVIRRLSDRVPMLGVCLGHQAIGVAFGATVKPCGPQHGIASAIKHVQDGLFADCPSPMQVGRYHSLAIDAETLPNQLDVTAYADDGTIMGVRHRSQPIFGVQFHPESVLSDAGLILIRNFVSLATNEVRSSDQEVAF